MAVGVVAQRLVAALVAVACLMLAVPSSAVAVGASVAKPSKVPTVPLDLTVVPGPASGQLVVSWAPPAYDGSFLNRFGQPVAYVLTDYDLALVFEDAAIGFKALALDGVTGMTKAMNNFQMTMVGNQKLYNFLGITIGVSMGMLKRP